jgi:hypothetical protein
MVGIVTENDTVQMFRAGDSDYPSYTAPDFSNKVVKSLKREDKREALIAKFKADVDCAIFRCATKDEILVLIVSAISPNLPCINLITL